MSTGTSTQTTLQGEQPAEQKRERTEIEDLHSFALVLWEIGLRDDLEDTEAELREANRICRERGFIGGGER